MERGQIFSAQGDICPKACPSLQGLLAGGWRLRLSLAAGSLPCGFLGQGSLCIGTQACFHQPFKNPSPRMRGEHITLQQEGHLAPLRLSPLSLCPLPCYGSSLFLFNSRTSSISCSSGSKMNLSLMSLSTIVVKIRQKLGPSPQHSAIVCDSYQGDEAASVGYVNE